jgi:hypothetical protein
MFGIAHIEVNVVNGFDLQEIRLLGHWAGRVRGLDTVVAIQPPLVGMGRFYDKGGLIANKNLEPKGRYSFRL